MRCHEVTIIFLDTMDTISGFSGKSLEKNVQKKD